MLLFESQVIVCDVKRPKLLQTYMLQGGVGGSRVFKYRNAIQCILADGPNGLGECVCVSVVPLKNISYANMIMSKL